MATQNEKNKNLQQTKSDDNADQSNMPENQIPTFRSNENNEPNKVKSDAGFLGREAGGGDFGSEEARMDPEKGNQGHAGNMPNSAEKTDLETDSKD